MLCIAKSWIQNLFQQLSKTFSSPNFLLVASNGKYFRVTLIFSTSLIKKLNKY